MIMKSQEKKPWTNKWLKLAMIIAIVVIGFPIVIPLGAGILALIAGIVIAVFCLFCSDCNRLCGSGDGRCCTFAAGIEEACSPIRVWDLRFLEQD